MKKSLHIVITGGHHNSALVVAQKLLDAGVKVSWIGHRQAARGDQNDSAEYLEVTNAKISFYNLVAGKFTLHGGISNIVNIPIGIFRAAQYLKILKPDAVLSFGGYLGFAVGIAAFVRRIPLYLHEQTVISGLSNRVLSLLSNKVYLTWESSLIHFPKYKSKLIGLPLRSSVLEGRKIKLFDNTLPIILVMGGKQGSHLINKLIFKHLSEILSSYNLIHQTGTNSETHDYDQSIILKDALPAELATRYQSRGYIGESEIGNLLTSTDYYLGRSGAHITYELGVLGIPAVLIPYPHTHGKEQLLNARVLEKFGLALILPESDLSFPHLLDKLRQVRTIKSHSLNLPREAGHDMVQSLLSDLS